MHVESSSSARGMVRAELVVRSCAAGCFFCGCALTAATSQRPPLETSVMSSDQSAIDRHLLGATSSEWCGFARAEP
eukprot:2582004-Prymnesium_polylepis.1